MNAFRKGLRTRTTVIAASVLVAALSLSACGSPTSSDAADQAARNDPNTIQILGGSELADLSPVLAQAAKETGVKVRFDYTGTLDGAQTVASGGANGKYDATWFPSNRYLTLLPGAKDKIDTSTKIMQSPVILGVKTAVASKLGWDKKAPTWAQVADAAAKGDFKYGMTNPSASNSGFSALVAVATALANTGNALTAPDITAATPALKAFFSGQKLTAGSSGWISSKLAQDPSVVDGVINYESVLATMDTSAVGPMTLVTPADGVVTADYPLSTLSSANPDKKAKIETLVKWLTTPAAQQAIMDTTSRRPAVPGVALAAKFSTTPLVEQPFPNTLAVTNQLIDSYLSTIRRPSQTIFSLDTSGSMDGPRITSLKAALKNLAGSDTSTTGSFAAFQAREKVTLIPFSDQVHDMASFTVPATDKAPVLSQISAAVDNLRAGGGTAIYDSLAKGYAEASQEIAENPDSFTSIVLMTDGENNMGIDAAQFTNYYNSLSPAAKRVPVFVIIFGEGSPTELQNVASLTGGKTFDARKSDLNSVFREIRGYQ
jgi:Ca-activated chloride channel homolog